MRTRPSWIRLLAAAGAIGLAGGSTARAVESFPVHVPNAPLLPVLRDKLPADLRPAAEKWLHLEPRQQRALASLTPGDLRSFVLSALAQDKEAEDFVLSELPSQSRTAQFVILGIMTLDPNWQARPGIADTLTAIGRKAGDPAVALQFFETARRLETGQLRLYLAERIASARAKGDSAELDQLANQDELWMKVEKSAMLPGFLAGPPPPFSVLPAGRPIRIVAFGDFGEGTPAQREVAAAIIRRGAEKPFDFGLTLGDNFYPRGIRSLADPRWRDWWEKLYGPLHILFYATFGNHDWYDPDSPAAEILYTKQSPTWRMPGEYYTFTAGPVQFFALDTDDIAEAQAIWLEQAITQSRAKWRVVYGHHPIFAAMDSYYTAYMRQRLWPLIRGRVDLYLCGHQHAMEHLKPADGVHFWLSGGGGAHLHSVVKGEAEVETAASTFGYTVLEADPDRLTVTLYDGENRRLDGETIRK